MKKYLITGFAGFVGFHFIKHLSSVATEKIAVLGVDINYPFDFSISEFPKLELSYKSINLLNYDDVRSVIVDFKPTHILHLASLSSVGKSWQEPSNYFSNNTGIFLNIIEAVRETGIMCKILNIGSSEEYGLVNDSQLPLKEEMSIIPANPYAVSKMAQENLASVYRQGFGINIVSTRSFNHFGPRQRETFVVASFTKQIAQASNEGKKQLDMTTGNLNVIRDFLDVRDVVNAYYLLLENDNSKQIYNVCSGEGVSLIQMINELSKISGIEIITHTDPGLVRPNDIPKIIGCNERLKNDVNWSRKIDLQQTLRDTFNYWKIQLSK